MGFFDNLRKRREMLSAAENTIKKLSFLNRTAAREAFAALKRTGNVAAFNRTINRIRQIKNLKLEESKRRNKWRFNPNHYPLRGVITNINKAIATYHKSNTNKNLRTIVNEIITKALRSKLNNFPKNTPNLNKKNPDLVAGRRKLANALNSQNFNFDRWIQDYQQLMAAHVWTAHSLRTATQRQ